MFFSCRNEQLLTIECQNRAFVNFLGYNAAMQNLNLPAIKIESFEGPFDLLLELARKRKVNLSEISLRSITDDFLRYITGDKIPLSIQGDFLVVAATLLLMKIRLLTPSLSPQEEQEVTELTGRVRIYELYRSQADVVRDKWDTHRLLSAHAWSSTGAYSSPDAEHVALSFSTRQLADALRGCIRRLPKPVLPKAHLRTRGRSLQECLNIFHARLQKAKRVVFQETVQGASAQDTAISFLAVLELARKKTVSLEQAGPFAHIVVRKQS